MKWEYTIFQLAGTARINLTDELNKFGFDGWELVTIDDSKFYFKRLLTEKKYQHDDMY